MSSGPGETELILMVTGGGCCCLAFAAFLVVVGVLVMRNRTNEHGEPG